MVAKNVREVIVLEGFLKSTRLLESYSIQPCQTPEPDCLCNFSDKTRLYFELSEIIDQKIAQNFFDPKPDSGGGFFIDDILTDRIKEKLSKKYQTNGVDVELLLYLDLQPCWPEMTMIDQVRMIIESQGKEPFKKVWLFSVPKGKVIASF